MNLDQLLDFVVVQKMLSPMDNTTISDRQEIAMQEFCAFIGEPIPDQFVMVPCNSPAILLHWKALLLIAASLDEDEREYWKANFQSPDAVEEQDADIAAPVHTVPEAFDSHFHLDRTLRDMKLSSEGCLEDVLANAPVDEDKKINLVGSVAIYCDPRTYPTDRYLQNLPGDQLVGLGFHPKHSKYSESRIRDEIRQFRRLVCHPRIIAFGEVGLDHSVPMKYWAFQVDLLKELLPFLEDRHVLVIHCRGMAGDCGTEAYLLLLHFLKKSVRTHHRIHLHCFTGNKYVLERWLEVFPRTYFGFTNVAVTFTEDQVAALRHLEEDRLLLETDAPYFPPVGTEIAAPCHLWSAAAAVAAHRGVTPEHILHVTLENGRHLYQRR